MKLYYIQYGIGKAKYVINFHNGIKKHKDGSISIMSKSLKTKRIYKNLKKPY